VHVVRRVSGYKKIRYYTHENIGYGPVNLPDQELHTTAAWWQLPQAALETRFASRQQALDGFLGAAYALHIVATVAVMAEARDLQKAVAAATAPGSRRPTATAAASCAAPTAAWCARSAQSDSTPTVFLYDNFPGGVGQSEPLWRRQAELLARAGELVQRCDCRAGCPACVGPDPRGGRDGGQQPRRSRWRYACCRLLVATWTRARANNWRACAARPARREEAPSRGPRASTAPVARIVSATRRIAPPARHTRRGNRVAAARLASPCASTANCRAWRSPRACAWSSAITAAGAAQALLQVDAVVSRRESPLGEIDSGRILHFDTETTGLAAAPARGPS
jgi:hypothetical protein